HALEQASGRDLSAWSREWLQTAGPNTLRPSFTVDGEGRFDSFAVLQEAGPDHPTLRSHRVAIGLYDHTPEGLARVERVEIDVVGARTEVLALVGRSRPAIVLVNDDDLTYARIRLDEDSLAVARTSIGALTESLPRALCWAAAWDMVRTAEAPARDFVAMVLGGIDSETDIGVVETLQANVVTALTYYVDPSAASAMTADVATAARQRLLSAAPGSDLQLAW